jgi:hypothetical protein
VISDFYAVANFERSPVRHAVARDHVSNQRADCVELPTLVEGMPQFSHQLAPIAGNNGTVRIRRGSGYSASQVLTGAVNGSGGTLSDTKSIVVLPVLTVEDADAWLLLESFTRHGLAKSNCDSHSSCQFVPG